MQSPTDLVFLCSNDNPAVAIVSQKDGRQLPMFLPGDGAFDYGLLRQGYVVAKIGYLPVAIEDGRPLSGTALPMAWRCVPSVDPAHVLVDRYFGGSKKHREPNTIVLLDKSGNVLRSCQTHAGNLVGELASGQLVAIDGFFDWDGKVVPAKKMQAHLGPRFGDILAVVAGRWVLTAASWYANVLVLVDTQSKKRITVRRTHGKGLYNAAYNIDASAVAFAAHEDGVLVIHSQRKNAPAVAQFIALGFSCYTVVWLHNGSLLAIGDKKVVLLDPVTGAVMPTTLPKHCHPRIDVTNRLSIDEVAASILPARTTPMLPKEFAAHHAKELVRLRAAAKSAGATPKAVAAHMLPGVRLRTVPATKPPTLGQSCFGGRPGLPAGYKWPVKDGVPYAFFAQLRCDELYAALPPERSKALAIPKRGWIVIFVAMEADGMHPLFDSESVWADFIDAGELKRLAFPKKLHQDLRLPCVGVSIEPCVTLPDCGEAAAFLKLSKLDDDQLAKLHEALDPPGPRHQLLGHKSSMQGFATPQDQELLLQLDTDGLLEVMFGDGGRLHLFKPKALALLPSLSKLTVELDCG